MKLPASLLSFQAINILIISSGKAKELQAKTPDVFTVHDLRAGKLRDRGITDVLVDDMEQIIGEAIDSYLGVHVVAGTMTKKNDER